ncbi:MAG: glycosyltransferase [Actinomycetota bacterium]|nr:glycosyltransferase [Actinomycetota bacterium]
MIRPGALPPGGSVTFASHDSADEAGTVLLVVHALAPEEQTGAPLVAQGYATSLARRGWNVAVLSTSGEVDCWSSPPVRVPVAPVANAGGVTCDSAAFLHYRVPVGNAAGISWSLLAPSDRLDPDRRERKYFESVLDQVRPDLVHVVDNVNMSLDWPELARQRGVPVLRSVSCAEDLCALIAPVSPRSGPLGFCQAPLTPGRCTDCAFSALAPPWQQDGDPPPSHPARKLASDRWRSTLSDLLARKRERAAVQFREVFHTVVFATAAWRTYFEASLPLGAGRGVVVPMGLEPPPGLLPRKREWGGGPLRIVLASTLDAAKGVADVAEAFGRPELARRDDYRLEIHGGGNTELVQPLVESNPNVSYHGAYGVSDLACILGDAHVGLSPSLFETFHRVTREYLLAGVPVVGGSALGVSEALVDGCNSVTYDRSRPGGLSRAVLRLLDDPGLVGRLSEGALSTAVPTVEDEVDGLVRLYQDIRRSAPSAVPVR